MSSVDHLRAVVSPAALAAAHRLVAGIMLPILVSTAFLLITDIANPRHGIIKVPPKNLLDFALAAVTAPSP